jgi:hypothetical protein
MDREPPEPPTNERPDAADTGPPEARIPAGETAHQVSRRSFLGMLGLGAGTVAVVGAAGLTWRAVDQGVFATGTGSAYAAWDGWNPPGGNVLDLVRAAVLAASAHNTQPWRFRVSPTRIDLFADTARNIGTIDPPPPRAGALARLRPGEPRAGRAAKRQDPNRHADAGSRRHHLRGAGRSRLDTGRCVAAVCDHP